MYFLINGIVATGAGVFHPGHLTSPTNTAPFDDEVAPSDTLNGQLEIIDKPMVSDFIYYFIEL